MGVFRSFTGGPEWLVATLLLVLIGAGMIVAGRQRG
jgi:hypothetical protein